MPPRYAVYYVPESGSPLELLGSGIVGRNTAGQDVPHLRLQLPAPLHLEDITVAPRHYGLHATLKAPFELAKGRTVVQLRGAVQTLARAYSTLLLPPMMVGTVPNGQGGQGSFLALRPTETCTALQGLAEQCVRELDLFRAPLSSEDIERRKNLSPRQQANMLHWGYPHVLEDFYFHLTLTDSLKDAALRQQIAVALQLVLVQVCTPYRVMMRGLTLMQQSNRQSPFRFVTFFPFQPLD